MMYDKRPWHVPFEMCKVLHRLDLMDTWVSIMDYSHFYDKHATLKRVLIVGQNPSDDSPDNSAFHEDTKSGKTVRGWFKDVNVVGSFCNLYDYKHKDHGRPVKSDITLPEYVKNRAGAGVLIIGCGALVQDVLRKNGIKHFAIPHPSGLNRFWNDKEAGEAKIREMLRWIDEQKS